MSHSVTHAQVPVPTSELMDGDGSQRDFDVVLRGYDRAQVEHHLEAMEALLAQAEQAAEAARAEAAELRRQQDSARVQAAPDDAGSYAGLGRRVGRILALAEEEAAAIRTAARQQTSDARAEIARLEREVAERRQQLLRDAEHDASRISSAAHDRAEALLEDARQRAQRTVEDARAEADAMLRAAREEVDRLAGQRDEIRAQLDQLRDRLLTLTGTTPA